MEELSDERMAQQRPEVRICAYVRYDASFDGACRMLYRCLTMTAKDLCNGRIVMKDRTIRKIQNSPLSLPLRVVA